MTFERYVAIVYPLQHTRYVNNRKVYIMIGVVWMLGPLWLTAYAVSSSTVKHGVCTVYSEWPSNFVQKLVSVATLLVQYLTPICSITFAYIHIFITLRRKQDTSKGMDMNSIKREERMSKARRNVIKTLAQVFACFVFCWSWNQIYFALFNFGYPLNLVGTFYQFTVVFVFANSCLNPVVYTINYEQFKQVQRELFCPCIKKQQRGKGDEFSKTESENVTQQTKESASPGKTGDAPKKQQKTPEMVCSTVDISSNLTQQKPTEQSKTQDDFTHLWADFYTSRDDLKFVLMMSP